MKLFRRHTAQEPAPILDPEALQPETIDAAVAIDPEQVSSTEPATVLAARKLGRLVIVRGSLGSSGTRPPAL